MLELLWCMIHIFPIKTQIVSIMKSSSKTFHLKSVSTHTYTDTASSKQLTPDSTEAGLINLATERRCIRCCLVRNGVFNNSCLKSV